MSRPQGVTAGGSTGNPTSGGHRIDASVCARAGTTIERSYTTVDLPRLREAGARDGTVVEIAFVFSEFDGRVAIDGTLSGVAMLVCQRCVKPVEISLQDEFKVVLVQDEAELDQEPGGYEAVLADPARFDLQALAEDQALLALPLVPRHESEQCGAAPLAAKAADNDKQRPFGNLRDLMER